ncbi:MAG TPA: hypothetical protein VGV38_11515 [Pyrinomonadaceae bacterium]|nr:hypothetical protein [Pyrinomonadaceae bacterium]
MSVSALNQTSSFTVEAVPSSNQVAAAYWTGTKYQTTATVPVNGSVTFSVGSSASNTGYNYEIQFKSSACLSAILKVKVE